MLENWRETSMLIVCIAMIYFLYLFVYQSHFVISPELSEIEKRRMRVTYMQSGDFYPMSWKFPRLLNQIRHSTRKYRQDEFLREFGNYGTFDHQSYGGNLVDPVGALARP